MFSLNYTLTRPFPGRWFAPVVFSIAVISLALLIALNVALTGYETITVFNSNFNLTQTHWFDRWIPTRMLKAGALCDPHVFNVGDSFATNYTVFQWAIGSVTKANAGDSGVSYQGSTLKGCDITSLYLNGDMHISTLDVTAVIRCVGEFEVNARTTFSVSSLPGVYSPLLGVMRTPSGQDDTPVVDPRTRVIDQMTSLAASDIGRRLIYIIKNTNNTSPVVLSIEADFPWCPASLGTSADCATNKPEFNISLASAVYPNTSLVSYSSAFPVNKDNPRVITDDHLTPVSNLIQTIYAAIRIDLGNPSPNNFLLNPPVVNNVLFPTFPQTANAPANASLLYEGFTNPALLGLDKLIPLNVTSPANIQVVYLCRFQRPKEAGSLLISVLVATLSMFSSGWAVLIFAATFFIKRDPLKNRCEGHNEDQSEGVGAHMKDGYQLTNRMSHKVDEADAV